METLKFPIKKNVNWDYDREADVLYISFGKPKPALTTDMGNGLFARYNEATQELIGLTIIEARHLLQKEAVPTPS